MQRLKVFAPGETKVMITPPSCDRQVEFVAPASLERPAVILDRPLEHIERMEFDGRFFLMGEAHRRLLMLVGKTKQLASSLTQDFVFRQESRLARLWGSRTIHNFNGTEFGPSSSVFSLTSNSASRAASCSFSMRAFDAIALTASNSSRGTKSISATRRSRRWRINVSSSVRTLWAAPAASVKKRAKPSSSGFSVCMGRPYGRRRCLRQALPFLTLTGVRKGAFFPAIWSFLILTSIRCSFISARLRSAGMRFPISQASFSAGGISFSLFAHGRSGRAQLLVAALLQPSMTLETCSSGQL